MLALEDSYDDDLDLLGDLLADISAGGSHAENRSAIAIEVTVPGAGRTYLIKA